MVGRSSGIRKGWVRLGVGFDFENIQTTFDQKVQYVFQSQLACIFSVTVSDHFSKAVPASLGTCCSLCVFFHAFKTLILNGAGIVFLTTQDPANFRGACIQSFVVASVPMCKLNQNELLILPQ